MTPRLWRDILADARHPAAARRLALLAQSMIPPLTVASRFKDLYADAAFRADEIGVLRRELGELPIAAEADEELRGVLRGLIRWAAKAHADDAYAVGLVTESSFTTGFPGAVLEPAGPRIWTHGLFHAIELR